MTDFASSRTRTVARQYDLFQSSREVLQKDRRFLNDGYTLLAPVPAIAFGLALMRRRLPRPEVKPTKELHPARPIDWAAIEKWMEVEDPGEEIAGIDRRVPRFDLNDFVITTID